MTRDEVADFAPAVVTEQVDNARVRVTHYHFPPRSQTGWHRHVHDYVVVPTINGTLTILEPDGSCRDVPYIGGESYFRPHGAEHNVVNRTGAPVAFVEIELM
jgi:quercetin dioxygenase-like cupin family protein